MCITNITLNKLYCVAIYILPINVSTKVYSYTRIMLFQNDDEELQPQLQVDEADADFEEEEPAETLQVECQHEEQASTCTSIDPQSR